jgi:outer membrane protein OmpA-like peptidoglycan-associated protein
MFWIGLMTFTSVLSQDKQTYTTSSKKAIKYYESGNQFIRMRKFQEAIEVFNQAVKKDPDFVEAHLKLAFCYDVLRNLPAQLHHLEEVVRINPANKKYRNVYYSLSKVYFNLGKYDDAEKMIQAFLASGPVREKLKKSTDWLLKNIEFAREEKLHPLDIHPGPLPSVINRFPLQYFPVLTADEGSIIFTGRKGFSYSDDEDIYISSKNCGGEWQIPESISVNINSQFNEGTCSISADGRTLIFTSCVGRDGYGSCDLFVSYKTGEEWSMPVNLGPAINSRSWESQPSLSADGRKLYFISNRPGGIGKRDIWISDLGPDGLWKPAHNLGDAVNTSEDEVSPFIHVDGQTLFFASRGYPGMGGFDIYKSVKNNGGWSDPENIGYPINDHNDQVSLFISATGKNAYYSHETQGNIKEKKSLLYTFSFKEKDVMVRKSNYLKGMVVDVETNKPLRAKIELRDLDSGDLVHVFWSDSVTGNYFSVLTEGGLYGLYVESPGYLFETKTFDYVDVSDPEPVIQDFFMKPMRRGATTVLNNIFFEFDSYELKKSSFTELEKVVKFLQQNPEIHIEIRGHTDNLGDAAYNQKLSGKRAQAVYRYLIKAGVDPERLTYKGYGEEKPVASNEEENGRSLNRRIEFRITK